MVTLTLLILVKPVSTEKLTLNLCKKEQVFLFLNKTELVWAIQAMEQNLTCIILGWNLASCFLYLSQ